MEVILHPGLSFLRDPSLAIEGAEEKGGVFGGLGFGSDDANSVTVLSFVQFGELPCSSEELEFAWIDASLSFPIGISIVGVYLPIEHEKASNVIRSYLESIADSKKVLRVRQSVENTQLTFSASETEISAKVGTIREIESRWTVCHIPVSVCFTGERGIDPKRGFDGSLGSPSSAFDRFPQIPNVEDCCLFFPDVKKNWLWNRSSISLSSFLDRSTSDRSVVEVRLLRKLSKKGIPLMAGGLILERDDRPFFRPELFNLYAYVTEAISTNDLLSGVVERLVQMSVRVVSDQKLVHWVSFSPSYVCHVIHCLIPRDAMVNPGLASSLTIRKALHERFHCPCDRPLFRPSDRIFSLSVSCRTSSRLILRDVHRALPERPSGTSVLVSGSYSYYHYRQDMDDVGWGCAYRSLQTLCSWFMHERFVRRFPPSIREIQEVLVMRGDKPDSFVGSREWIGSVECSFVLDALYDVECRIQHLSSGEELRWKGDVLINHFREEGTPVMVGGGNVAYTMLGVDWNRKSNDISFLILDPHYQGADERGVKPILKGGWCGWKPVSFFTKDRFCNLCMPMRPRITI